MVQVIDLGPTEQENKNAAFEAGLRQAAMGLGKVSQGIQATQRQKAMKLERDAARKDAFNLELAKRGIDPGLEAGQLAEGEMGPPEPTQRSVGLGQLAKQVRGQQEAASKLKTDTLKAQTEANRLKRIDAENKQLRTTRRALVKDRQNLDKEFQPFDRLFGTIGNLRKNFDAGKMSGTDKFQLVRAFVPLSEINPGVVRDSEFDSVTAQGSTLSRLQQMAEKEFKQNGTIPDDLVKQIFETSDSIQDAIFRGKESRLGNIAEEVELEGFNDKNRGVILGKNNLSFLEKQGKRRVEQQRLAENQKAQQAQATAQNQSFFGNIFNSAQAATGEPRLLQTNPKEGQELMQLRALRAQAQGGQ